MQTNTTDIRDLPISHDNVEAFTDFLQSHFNTFYRQDLGAVGVAQWFGIFINRCTLREFMSAMVMHASTPHVGKGLPQPLPADIFARLQDSHRPQAVWKHVMFAVVHYGSHYTPTFDDKRIHHVIDELGGWPKFCSRFTDDRKEQEIQQQFMAAFSMAQPVDIPLLGSFGANSRQVEFKFADNKLKISVKPLARISKGPSNA